MRKNVCYDNYYDFPFDTVIPKFTAHLCIKPNCHMKITGSGERGDGMSEKLSPE